MPWVPLASMISCAALMVPLPRMTWIRFVAWLVVGLVIYFAYGVWRSRLRARG